MAWNAGAVDLVLPVVWQIQVDMRLRKVIPDALFSPAPEPDIVRVPLPVSLVHVSQGAAHSQYLEHAIEEAPVIASWPRPAISLTWQKLPGQLPFRVRQIPATHDYSSKKLLWIRPTGQLGNLFVNTAKDSNAFLAFAALDPSAFSLPDLGECGVSA
jgi:hypothetical protein